MITKEQALGELARRELARREMSRRQSVAGGPVKQGIMKAVGTGLGLGQQALEGAYEASNPLEKALLRGGGKVLSGINKIYQPIKKSIMEAPSVMNLVRKALPDKPVFEANIPVRRMKEDSFDLEETGNVPVSISPQDIAEGVQGGAVDLLATIAAPGALKGTLNAGKKTIKTGGKLARGVADVPTKSVKRLRELGPENVFKPEIEAEDFVSKIVTPKASSIIEKNIKNLEPSALRKVGIKPDVIDDVMSIKKEHGITKLPTTKEADDFFEKVTRQSTVNGIRPETFKENISSSLSEMTAALGREHPLSREFSTMLDDLKNAESISKTSYLATRRKLNSLMSGDGEFDKIVMQAKEALDNDAAYSGITGIKKAKALYKVSRDLEKVDTYLTNPKRLESVQSELEKAQKLPNFQAKESLRALLGDEADSIIKSLEANRIAREFSPRGFGSTGKSGITKGVARAGVRAYEEKIRPTLRSFVRKKT